ncbi:CRISPR-associated endonuclease Cas1 [soil metagenome]
MNITISDYGTFIGVKSQRLRITKKGKLEREVPLIDLDTVTLLGKGVSLSVDAVAACAEHGVQVNFHTRSGDAYAKLTSPYLVGTVATRREQMAAYLDTRGLVITQQLISGKLENQRRALRYFAKYRKETAPALNEALELAAEKISVLRTELASVTAASVDEVRGLILSIEGRSGVVYWSAVAKLLPDEVTFPGRVGRGATDDVNSCLNYAYGILYARCWGALATAGLEPFAGFLHTDRPGKPSLVLDFIEEYRTALADRSVLAMFNKGFRPEFEKGSLSAKTRTALAARVIRRLETRHSYQRRNLQYASIMVAQARQLALFLRSEATYEPFVGAWT